MTKEDVIGMKQKIAEYEHYDQELTDYAKLIYQLTNAGSIARVTFGVSDTKKTFRLTTAQVNTLVGTLVGFQNDAENEMQQL